MLTALWWGLWTKLYYGIFRSVIKWLLRIVTRKCELLRITYEDPPGAQRTQRIEQSLRLSKDAFLRSLVTDSIYSVSDAVKKVMEIKQIASEIHPRFPDALSVCLQQIKGILQLQQEIEERRTTAYSSNNPDHEALLLKLWSSLKPDIPLGQRVTKQWTTIGFQGDDPKTDFRGMGMLSLDQLVYFCDEYASEALQVFSYSHHPQFGFPYAIVGISITNMVYNLLKSRKLCVHFYNVSEGKPGMNEYHQVYCSLFYDFTNFWMSETPKDIMEFKRVHDKFFEKVANRLQKPTAVLTSQFQQQKK